MVDDIKNFIDWVAVGAAFGTLLDWLPLFAAGAAIVWTLMRIIMMWPEFKKHIKDNYFEH